MRTAHVLAVCTLVTLAAGPALAGPAVATRAGVPGLQTDATEITTCTEITDPGSYVLTSDIEAADRESCIRIRTGNVTLDGHGHLLDGGASQADFGPFVQTMLSRDPSPSDERWGHAGVVATNENVSNVTVRNVQSTGWQVGISLLDIVDGVVRNVSTEANGFGVAVVGGSNSSLVNATAESNAGVGIFLFNARNSTVSDASASNNGFAGVYAFQTSHTTVEQTVASSNQLAGILLDEDSSGTIENTVTTMNDLAGVYLFGTNNTSVTNVRTFENRQIGVYLRDADAVDVHNVEANANTVLGILLEDVTDGTVSNSTANLNGRSGIVAVTSPRSRIVNSIATGNEFAGVSLIASDEFTVTESTARNNVAGITAENISHAMIRDTILTDNRRTGVLLFNTTGSSVVGTNASTNGFHGMFVLNASETIVARSNASYNGLTGVYLRNATNNTIANNTLLANAISGVLEENATGNRLQGNDDGATTIESTEDEIGTEGGISHDDEIDINQSDGLSTEELRQYVYRAIARVEYIRGLEFEQAIDVEVITRSENRRRTMARPRDSGAVSTWRNLLWEALFLIGEDTNASEELDEFRGERVLGYYLSAADTMVIVTPDDGGEVDSVTLVHEFVHALQDQHFDLTESADRARTEDAQRARNGLVEGDASYVEEQFELLCGAIWNCVESNSTSPRSAKIPDVNLGVSHVTGQPYSDGPGYVDRLRKNGSWSGVNEAYDALANTTEQIIHPEKADEPPSPLEFENQPTNGWARFNGTTLPFQGVNGTNSVGEAAIYTMFWYQGIEFNNSIIDTQSHFVPEGGAFDRLNYTSTPSAGWGNDVLVPYRKGNESAYVWMTTWDTRKDAAQFYNAYIELLDGHGAERRGDGVLVIPAGPFADAFHVIREGKTVTITNAPEVDDLTDVRPAIEGGDGEETMNSTGASAAFTGRPP